MWHSHLSCHLQCQYSTLMEISLSRIQLTTLAPGKVAEDGASTLAHMGDSDGAPRPWVWPGSSAIWG